MNYIVVALQINYKTLRYSKIIKVLILYKPHMEIMSEIVLDGYVICFQLHEDSLWMFDCWEDSAL